jgi:hypothetical protein
MIDWADLKIDGLEAAEGAFHVGERLVAAVSPPSRASRFGVFDRIIGGLAHCDDNPDCILINSTLLKAQTASFGLAASRTCHRT